MDQAAADALVEKLGLRYAELPLCAMCLFGVSLPLRQGDERETRSAIRFFGRQLWDDGLERPVREALAHAREEGVAGATEALEDVDARRFRSSVFRAVVRDLARQQAEEAERALRATMN